MFAIFCHLDEHVNCTKSALIAILHILLCLEVGAVQHAEGISEEYIILPKISFINIKGTDYVIFNSM